MECKEEGHVAHAHAHSDEDVRVLRRLQVREGFTGEGMDEGASVCAVVDVESTGLDLEGDALIQLAVRRIRYDADGVITRIGAPRVWFEDPGRPIPPGITELTGIQDEDVAGQCFPDDEVVKLLTRVTAVVAHHAAFDRKWVERRFPAAAGLAWACSMGDVPWDRCGLEGGKLAHLGLQCGFFYDAHRADADVDAVIGLLRHRFDDGRTALSLMMENAEAPSWIVRAEGAAYELKDRLRARRYRWDRDRRVWSKEVRDADRFEEEVWLAANIYAAEARPEALGPSFEHRTWWQRYA